MFRKLLLSAFLLLAFALVLLDFYLTRYTATRETQVIEQRLQFEARLVAYDLADQPEGKLQAAVGAVAQRAQSRITVIRPDGVVLADSQHDPETMENHASRPEVREALAGRIGSSVRHSATLDRDLCYVALPFTYRGQPGFVLRLAVPLTEVKTGVSAVRWRIIYASAATAALALVLAYFLSMRMSRRIRRIQAFAERLPFAGEEEALEPEANDELGALSRALNYVAARLRESMEQLRIESARREAILASLVDGVLAVDHKMRILFCNESFAQATGTAPAPAKGTHLLTAQRDSALFGMVEQVLRTGEPKKQRIELASRGERVFEAHAAPLAAEEGRGAVVVLHEITEIERLARVRQDFVANVSHELRTPLAAILGYAETLLEGAMQDSEMAKTFLETIKAHAVRLNNISADLLTLSELDSGVSTAPPSTFSLQESMESAVRTVEAEARLRQVQLLYRNGGQITLHSYRLRLEQALVNLLDNAIKFNRPGGQVQIESWCDSGQVTIRISDTGCGIPAQDLPRIFERFYRVDRARSRQVGGTGLGLSIVKHAVELMKGTIEVQSEVGKGSTFTMILPQVLPPH